MSESKVEVDKFTLFAWLQQNQKFIELRETRLQFENVAPTLMSKLMPSPVHMQPLVTIQLSIPVEHIRQLTGTNEIDERYRKLEAANG